MADESGEKVKVGGIIGGLAGILRNLFQATSLVVLIVLVGEKLAKRQSKERLTVAGSMIWGAGVGALVGGVIGLREGPVVAAIMGAGMGLIVGMVGGAIIVVLENPI